MYAHAPRDDVQPETNGSTMLCLSDIEKFAQNNLDVNAWRYFSSGATGQRQTLRDNEAAFLRYMSCITYSKAVADYLVDNSVSSGVVFGRVYCGMYLGLTYRRQYWGRKSPSLHVLGSLPCKKLLTVKENLALLEVKDSIKTMV